MVNEDMHTLPSVRRLRAWDVAAASLYAIAILLWFFPVWKDPNSRFIGLPTDTQQFMWYLGWFWHAVATHQNPFLTYDLNAPVGMNLMWNTSIVAESVVFGPLVPLLGLTATYNVLNAVDLWLMGWFAYRTAALCGVQRGLATLAGGLCMVLPAVSPQLLQHTHMVCLAPWFIGVYLIVRTLVRQPRRAGWWGAALGVAVAAAFYTSLELLALSVLAAAVGMLYLMVESAQGRRLIAAMLRRLPLRWWMGVIVTAAILCAPGLWTLAFGPMRPAGQFHSPEVFVNDFANLLLPTPIYLLHTHASAALAQRYTGNLFEWNGYLGPVAIPMLAWTAWRLRRHATARAMTVTLALFVLLSLGPHLHVAGRILHVPLPWRVVAHVPVLHQALPARVMAVGDLLAVALLVWAVHAAEMRHATTAGSPARNGIPSRDVTSQPSAHLPVSTAARRTRWSRLALAGVMATWLPLLPFPSSSTPGYVADLTANTNVRQALADERTLVVTDDFPSFMQAQAAAGYVFPVVNTYGFPPDPRRQWPWAGGHYPEWLKSPTSAAHIRAVLRGALAVTGAERVVYADSQNRQPPLPLRNAITQVLGQPVAVGNHVIVWSVPRPSRASRTNR